MKKIIVLVIFITITLSACNSSVISRTSSIFKPRYDYKSWKKIIPKDCQYFSDGCNTCSRIKGQGGAVCTRIGCTKYVKPKCLDDKINDDQK